MKLLAIAIPHHDVNISYFDGDCLRYHKLERTKQIKRYKFDNLLDWKQEIESLWGIDLSEIDDIVLTFDVNQLPAVIKNRFYKKVYDRVINGTDLILSVDSDICDYFGIKNAWFINHHYAHSQSTWMMENKPSDVSIVIDGVGDGRTWSVFKNEQLIDFGDIKCGSVGWGMREAGKILGLQYGHYNDIAGKVMGVQSYGIVDENFLKRLQQFDISQLNNIFSIDTWLEYKQDEVLAKNTLIDWIKTVHKRMEQVLVEHFASYAEPGDTISYTGGVAQNVIWNTVLRGYYKNIIIPPHSSDEGLSLGAIEWLRKKHKLPKLSFNNFPYCQADKAPITSPTDKTIELIATLLAEGKTVGWYQGNGEVGPRALGNRSILMDPRIRDGKQLINKIKKRENFRPFGASILKEKISLYFDADTDDYMLYTSKVKTDEFPAITHIDGTCRVQTVGYNNKIFRKLLEKFYELTGCPVLLNTSLNLAGKPIAGYLDNAVEFFYSTELDCMVIGDTVYRKNING